MKFFDAQSGLFHFRRGGGDFCDFARDIAQAVTRHDRHGLRTGDGVPTEKTHGPAREEDAHIAQGFPRVEVHHDQHALPGGRIVAEVAVEPVAAHAAIEPPVARVFQIVGIERIEIAIAEGRLIDGGEKAAVKITQRLLLIRKAATVESAIIDPFGKLRHRPVVVNRGARIIGPETLRTRSRFAHLLTVVKHDRPARESEKQGRNRTSDLHARPTPLRCGGQAHFIVVLGVAQGVIEKEKARTHLVEVIGRGGAFVNLLQRIVGDVVVDGIETRIEQLRHDRAVRDFENGRIAARNAGRIGVISLGHPINPGLALARASEEPAPEFGRNHVGHVGAESIDSEVLPVSDDLIHLLPSVGNRDVGGSGVGIFARGFFRIGEVVAVVEFDRLIPRVLRGGPTDHIVPRDAAEFLLAVEKSVAPAHRLHRGARRTPVAVHGGKAQRRTAALDLGFAGEVVKIVFGIEELVPVIVGPEGEFRSYVRSVAARHMVGHEVDEHFHALGMDAVDHRFEFFAALGRIVGVIGRDVEVVADGVRTAGHAFEQIGVVGRFADVRIIGGRGLLEDTGDPDVGETHGLEFAEGGVIEVAELARTVLGDRCVRLARLVGVSEKSRQHLVNANLRRLRVRAPGASESRAFAARLGLNVVADGAFAGTGDHGGIDRPVETAPSILHGEILEVDRDLQCFGTTDGFVRDTQEDLRRFRRNGESRAGRFARTPLRGFPAAQIVFVLVAVAIGHEQKIRRERKPDRGTFFPLPGRNQRGAMARARAQGDEHGLGRTIHARAKHENIPAGRCFRDAITDLIRSRRIIAAAVGKSRGCAKKEKQSKDGAAHGIPYCRRCSKALSRNGPHLLSLHRAPSSPLLAEPSA